MVDVVMGTPALSVTGLPGAVTEDPNDVDRFPIGELWPTADVGMADTVLACDSGMEVALTCLTVAEAVPQSKPMLWIPTSQLLCFKLSGSLNVTEVAPPHWVFSTVEPPVEQELRCLQVDPSCIPYKKSSSVSTETETCMVVMEKDLPEPLEILGLFCALVETDPTMHLL